MQDKGILAIVSGPSAAGKGTVVRRAMAIAAEIGQDVQLSISMTTRGIKKDEEEGVTYYYVTRERFEEAIANDELIEYNCYNGNYYGTPKQAIKDRIERGSSVVLEIDVNGADQVVKLFPDAIRIFVMPPSMRELESRIRMRGRDTEEEILQRLAKAKEEIPRAADYDYIIINDIIEDAAGDLLNTIVAEKNRSSRKVWIIDEVLGK